MFQPSPNSFELSEKISKLCAGETNGDGFGACLFVVHSGIMRVESNIAVSLLDFMISSYLTTIERYQEKHDIDLSKHTVFSLRKKS